MSSCTATATVAPDSLMPNALNRATGADWLVLNREDYLSYNERDNKQMDRRFPLALPLSGLVCDIAGHGWDAFSFSVVFRGGRLKVEIAGDGLTVSADVDNPAPVAVTMHETSRTVEPGDELRFSVGS